MSKNMYIILICTAAIAACIRFVIYKHREEVKKALESPELKNEAKRLILAAERHITGTKRGQERLAWVIGALYTYVPPARKTYVKEADLIRIVNNIFNSIAIRLEDGTTVPREE